MLICDVRKKLDLINCNRFDCYNNNLYINDVIKVNWIDNIHLYEKSLKLCKDGLVMVYITYKNILNIIRDSNTIHIYVKEEKLKDISNETTISKFSNEENVSRYTLKDSDDGKLWFDNIENRFLKFNEVVDLLNEYNKLLLKTEKPKYSIHDNNSGLLFSIQENECNMKLIDCLNILNNNTTNENKEYLIFCIVCNSEFKRTDKEIKYCPLCSSDKIYKIKGGKK